MPNNEENIITNSNTLSTPSTPSTPSIPSTSNTTATTSITSTSNDNSNDTARNRYRSFTQTMLRNPTRDRQRQRLQRFRRRKDKCPLCRQEIQNIHKIYY